MAKIAVIVKTIRAEDTIRLAKENSLRRKPDRFQQVKKELIERHNRWIETNNSMGLYAHVIHAWRLERILTFTKNIQGKVLDIGCFDGFVSEMILKQGGKEVIGMDRLEKALELAAARGIRTIMGDIDDAVIDFPDSYFDCVLAGDVLVTVFDPDAVVEEMHRLLKPGGKLIITVPNLASIGNRMLMTMGWPPYNLEVRPRQGGYWRYFTFDTMRRLLCDHGFHIQTMESSVFVFPLYRLPWVHKFFAPEPEWKRHRVSFNKFLTRIFPELGENIVVLAERPA